MKKFLLLAICISLFTGCATTSMLTRDTKPEIKAKPDSATLVIIRDAWMGSPIVFWHYVDGKLIGETQGKTYFIANANPGLHYVVTATENTVVYQMDLQSGKTYYLRDGVIMGMWRARSSGFTPLTPQQAMEAIKECTFLELDPSKPHEDMDPKLYQKALEDYQAELKANPAGFKDVLEYKGY